MTAVIGLDSNSASYSEVLVTWSPSNRLSMVTAITADETFIRLQKAEN